MNNHLLLRDYNTELQRTSGNPAFQAKAGSKKHSQSKHIFFLNGTHCFYLDGLSGGRSWKKMLS